MSVEYIGVRSLVDAYNALGLPEREVGKIPEDATLEAIKQKIATPKIFEKLDIPETLVEACYHIEFAAELLDTFSETGYIEFLHVADGEYQLFLQRVPEEARAVMRLISASAMTYFHLEQYYSRRIKREDQFTEQEVIHYHLARGADSTFYGEIARLANQNSRGIVSGFRLRQALRDLKDEVLDLTHDVEVGLGVNVLRMSPFRDEKGLRRLADGVYQQAHYLEIPKPLKEAIKGEYERIISLL